jgi:hypothetical protein
MPRIRQVEPDARDRLVRSGRGHAQLRPYLEAIASLKGNQMLEVEPEERETMRLIRLRVTRASRQLGKALTCGTTREGSLLVWLAEPSKAGPTPVKRTRRKRNADGVLV